ncbi:MAG: TerC/Alx family metal homeostasis membrane protein, partial [Gemmatirosa sp.]
MTQPWWMWAGFTVFVLSVLALDLGVFHRKAHAVTTKEAGIWTAVWVSMAVLFGGGIYLTMGPQPALEFAAGYLVEEALSVDNLFVFILVFSYFRVPEELRHRVLFWGIIGALVMRGAMIFAGAVLIERFHWIIYVFGAFLVYTGIKMAVKGEDDIDPEHNPVLRLVRRAVPVTHGYRGQKFFVREAVPGTAGPVRRMATPLFVVLVLVETTDLVFAVDSIPAIFGVTR